MNRKQFLKRLGIGVAAVVVAPKVIAEKEDLKWEDTRSSRKLTKDGECEIKKTLKESLDNSTTEISLLPDFDVALFINNKEVKYHGYKRMPSSWILRGDTFRPQSVSFPLTPRKRKIQADEVRLFKNTGECIGIVPFGYVNEVWHGTFIIQW